MKNLLLTISILLLLSCASHDKQNKHYHTKIEPEKLQKDIVYTRKQLVKMHTDLYWYISKKLLIKSLISLTKSINQPLTPNEFYLKISPVVASVKQGHMGMSMITLTSPDSLKKKYKGSKHPLSYFDYEYLDNKLFIKKNRSEKDSVLQIGTEIININGIEPTYLFTKYRKTFTSDGYNKTAIPKFFARRINTFYINELGFSDSLTIKANYADTVFYHTIKRIFKKSKELTKKRKRFFTKNTFITTDSIKKPQKKN